jgi:predicted enzyme related to lactoylglutathione lyase
MMKIGEVGLLTADVIGLSNFYKKLLGVENENDDPTIQFILTEGTGLTIHNDGITREGNHQNICLAFTVDDVDAEYERLKAWGVKINEPPTVRPWGAKNMIFEDTDGNRVIFRSLPR